MYAVEFETDVTSPFIHLQNFEQFMNQHVHVKVIVWTDSEQQQAKQTLPAKRGYTSLSSFHRGAKLADFDRMDAYYNGI